MLACTTFRVFHENLTNFCHFYCPFRVNAIGMRRRLRECLMPRPGPATRSRTEDYPDDCLNRSRRRSPAGADPRGCRSALAGDAGGTRPLSGQRGHLRPLRLTRMPESSTTNGAATSRLRWLRSARAELSRRRGPMQIDIEMTKNRLADAANGRFVDNHFGVFGYGSGRNLHPGWRSLRGPPSDLFI